MPLRSLLLMLFLCAAPMCTAPMLAQLAQQPEPAYLHHPYRFRHINTEHGGLSQNTVFAALQDRKGFLWIATGDGLNRYDGYECKVFRHNPGDSTPIPTRQIFCVLVDSDGDIWCGTDKEVLRFIPQTGKFEPFYLPNVKAVTALSYIFKLFEDSKKRIWICAGMGVYWLDKKSKKVQLPSALHASGKALDLLPANFIESAQKRLLIGYGIKTNNGELRSGYYELDEKNDTFIPANITPENPDKYMIAVYVDKKGISWVHTYTPQNDRFTEYWKYEPATKTLRPSNAFEGKNQISHVYEDGLGNNWFMGKETLRIVNPLTKEADTIQYVAGDAQGLASTRLINFKGNSYNSGKHYLATEGGGVNFFRPKPKFAHVYRQNKAIPNQLSENMLWGMAEDSAGYVWIATIGGGINRFNPSTGEIRSFLGEDIMRPVMCDKEGAIWTAAFQFDLIRITNTSSKQPQITKFSLPKSLQVQPIYSIVQDRFGILWCGIVGNTVVCFNPKTQAFTRVFPGLGTYLFADSQGYIWSGGNGVHIFDPADADRISFFGKDSTPHLFTHFEYEENSLKNPSAEARAFQETKNEQGKTEIWIATIRGLDHFDPATKRFTHYNESNGMPNSYVYGILPDDNGNLWISTNRGLSKFNKAAKTWRNYSPYDGLQSYEFDRSSFVRLRKGGTDGRMKGWMLFGGVNGFNIFHPDSVRDNPEKPPVAITNILINEKPYSDLWRGFQKDSPQHGTAEVSELTALDLAWTDNTLSFEFAALEFTDPEKNQYAYMMEGIDQSWVSAGTLRTARYAGLSPGDYVFRVRACNNDGVWNEVGTSLRIRIVPPFWRTAWFYGLVLAGGIGLVVGTTRTISRQRFKRDLALATERLEAARLLETERLEQELALQRERLEKEIALEKERGRISQDLHDELGPGMTKILLLSSIATQASETESEEAGTSQAGMTHEITLAAQEVMKAMSGVVWLTKPENDSLTNLTAYIREYADDYLDRAGIRLEWSMTGAVPEWTMPGTVRRGVFLVVKECLNNVVKHSGASKASILLDFSTDNIVRVVISDNGRGFDPSNTRRFGNGMNNMQRRIEEIGGKFTLTSSHAGTRVEIAVVMKLGEES